LSIENAMHYMFKEVIHVNPLPDDEIKKIAKECTEKEWYNATPETIDNQPMARFLLGMVFDKYQYIPNDLEILLSQKHGQFMPTCKVILRTDFIKICDLYKKSKEVFE